MRVIGAEGDQLGVMPVEEALKEAGERGLDLVEVAPMARPPRGQDHGLRQVPLRARQGGKGSQEKTARDSHEGGQVPAGHQQT